MTSVIKRGLFGCAILAALAVVTCTIGIWWVQRGGRVLHRTELIGPETQAFVTFIAAPEDRALVDLFATVERRVTARRENQPEWLHSFSEFLAGAQVSGNPGRAAALFPLRGAILIEKPPGEEGQVVYVLSLGKKANLVRMFLGIADSERERETYRGEKILVGRGGHDVSMVLVENNIVLSNNRHAIHVLIDRLKAPSGSNRCTEIMGACIQGVDPGGEMPGFGGIINERKSLATVWQLGTGAPEGAEIALPDDFEGVGFRFGVASADKINGDGSFYFNDEEAAAGSREALETGLSRLFTHVGLKADVDVRQEGSRLAVSVEAMGVQAALDRFFAKLQLPSSAASR